MNFFCNFQMKLKKKNFLFIICSRKNWKSGRYQFFLVVMNLFFITTKKNRDIPKNNRKKTSKLFCSLKNIKYKLKKYLN